MAMRIRASLFGYGTTVLAVAQQCWLWHNSAGCGTTVLAVAQQCWLWHKKKGALVWIFG
jgi:hypothetical protein